MLMKSRALLLTLFLLHWLPAAWAADVILSNQDSFYPRLIRLANSGIANGRLIASFDNNGSRSSIQESVDGGATWAQVANITVPEVWHCCSGLFEMPVTRGTTPKGALLWASTTRDTAGVHRIRLYRSTDVGRTWRLLSTPVVGSTSGVWEPEFIFDNAGRLLMFYSSEEYKSSGYNQLLAHRVSTDGGLTWSSDVFDVAIPGGVARPGMAVVRKLTTGSWIMTYEICGLGCDVYVRFSANGANWGSLTSAGTRVESSSGNYFTNTPTIAWANDGSVNGKLVITGQVLRRKSDGAPVPLLNGRRMMVNTANGAGLWEEVATPLRAEADGGDACNGYSTQLLPSVDGQRVTQMSNIECRMFVASGSIKQSLPDGVYRIIAKQSGKALDVVGCSTANAANVQQWSWNAGVYNDCQRWELRNVGNGDFTISARHSGQRLEVVGCSLAQGANVQQYPDTGANCQKWSLQPVGEGDYRLVAKHSGQVLDVSAASASDGANVHQWPWWGGDNQRWRLEPVSANSVANGSYRVTPQSAPVLALDVNGCSAIDGANVQLWNSNGADCQKWLLAGTADGFYELTPRQAINQRLDVANAGRLSGANVQQWPSNGADAQRWSLERLDATWWRLVNKRSGRVLDVNACATTAGANVQQWDWLGGVCQRWSLTPAP